MAKRELALECDYRWELSAQQRFQGLVNGDEELARFVHVPSTVPELSTRNIMTSEWVQGVPIDKVWGYFGHHFDCCIEKVLVRNQLGLYIS